MNIYVANVSFDLQSEDLNQLFTPFGEVTSATIIKDKMTGQSRGFGFVEMPDEAAAQKAIAELDGSMVDSRPIKVNVAKPKSETGFGQRPERNYNNSGSYNKTRY